ncbi:hypothetical protein [Kaarinaea lacus]
MDRIHSTKWVVTIITPLILIASCTATNHHYDQSIDVETGKPQWVMHGTQTSKTERGRIFLGVGEAQTNGEFSRQATAANRRAKEELEHMLERFIEVVSRDYIASGAAAPAGYLEHQAPHYVTEMTRIVLPNAQIMEHWVDEDSEKIFAIAEIDYLQVVSLIEESSAVNPGFKDYLKSRGELVFDRIATQH